MKLLITFVLINYIILCSNTLNVREKLTPPNYLTIKKHMRIFRISTLIAERALIEGKSESAISDEIAAMLDMTPIQFGAIRRQTGGKVDLTRLVLMADYFGVALDDMMNPAMKNKILSEYNARPKVAC